MDQKIRRSILFTCVLAITFSAQATEFRRSTSIPLTDCNTARYASNLPKATAYINKIKDRIIANNPNVFVDDLDPEHICFGVELNSAGGRAWAEVKNRSVRVESALIQRVQNDAQLAVVIAHELAHLSMRHTLDANPITGPQRSAAQAAFSRIYTLLEQVFSANKGDENARLNRLLDAQRDIVNPLLESQIGTGASNNWEESEADIVGMNFYLRAGFTSEEIAWRSQQVSIAQSRGENVHGPPPNISAASRLAEANRICGTTSISTMTEPVRGNARYPSECWTTWRLLKREPEINATYRTLLNDNTSIVNLPGTPTLAEVKAEIEAAVVAAPSPAQRRGLPPAASSDTTDDNSDDGDDEKDGE